MKTELSSFTRREALLQEKMAGVERLLERKLLVRDRLIETELELASARERIAQLLGRELAESLIALPLTEGAPGKLRCETLRLGAGQRIGARNALRPVRLVRARPPTSVCPGTGSAGRATA